MKNKFDITKYDFRYFEWHKKNTTRYIKKNMDWFLDNFPVQSVIDYGCGIGAYLETAFDRGLNNLQGFDIGGEFVEKYTSDRVKPFIKYIDCTLPVKTEKFDCVISIETGEHIETDKSFNFVKNITESCTEQGIILFSAAQPGQNGTGHINLQKKEFWIEIFQQFNFCVDLENTSYISKSWSSLGAPSYIENNLIVFKKI